VGIVDGKKILIMAMLIFLRVDLLVLDLNDQVEWNGSRWSCLLIRTQERMAMASMLLRPTQEHLLANLVRILISRLCLPFL
jgi:hypothetical protein